MQYRHELEEPLCVSRYRDLTSALVSSVLRNITRGYNVLRIMLNDCNVSCRPSNLDIKSDIRGRRRERVLEDREPTFHHSETFTCTFVTIAMSLGTVTVQY